MPTPHEIGQGEQILHQAAANTSRTRTGQAKVRFQAPDGRPLAGLEVEIAQKSQDFLFGNLAFDLVWGDAPYRPELFKQRFLELFNLRSSPSTGAPMNDSGRPAWQRVLPVLEGAGPTASRPKVTRWCGRMMLACRNGCMICRRARWMPCSRRACSAWCRVSQTRSVSGMSPTRPSTTFAWDEATRQASAPSTMKHPYGGVPPWPRPSSVKSPSRSADWVERSLDWAYAANPRAALIVNDYNQEIDPNVRRRFFDLILESRPAARRSQGLACRFTRSITGCGRSKSGKPWRCTRICACPFTSQSCTSPRCPTHRRRLAGRRME